MPTYNTVSVHPLLHGLSARRCPKSPLFITRWVSRLLGLTLVSWAFAHVGVQCFSLRLPYLGVFHSLFFTCHWISFVYFSQWRYLHPLFLPGLWTGTGPQWTPRQSTKWLYKNQNKTTCLNVGYGNLLTSRLFMSWD